MLQQADHDTSSAKAQKSAIASVDWKMVFAYVGCAGLGCVVFQQVAEQEFSSVLTMAVLAQCLSFVLIGLQISSGKSVSGISGKTMILQALAICFRLSSTLFL